MGAACSGDKSAEVIAEKDVQIAKLKKAEQDLKSKYDKTVAALSKIDGQLKLTIVPRTLKEMEALEAKLQSVSAKSVSETHTLTHSTFPGPEPQERLDR